MVAFADDFFVLITGTVVNRLGPRATAILGKYQRWADFNHLKFSTGKTQALVFPKQKKISRKPTVKLNNHSIPINDTITYLGFRLNCQLSWLPHLDYLYDKISLFYSKLKRCSGIDWGISPKIRKYIYLNSVCKIVSYGSEIWYNKQVRVINRIKKIERIPLLNITRAYRTTSSSALEVLAGVIPLELTIEAESKMSNLFLHNDNPIDKIELPLKHPAELKTIDFSFELPTDKGIEIYTDGSKLIFNNEHRVGCAYTVYFWGFLIESKKFRLSNFATVFKAELWAILQSIHWVNDNNITSPVKIFSDSLSGLQALCCPEEREFLTHMIKDNINDNISLFWIKAHAGFRGNEEADSLAKSACEKQHIDLSDIKPKNTIKTEIFIQNLQLWQNQWDNTNNKGRHTHEFIKKVNHRKIYPNF